MAQAKQANSKNLMAKTWTKAGMVRRRFKAGKPRQKDLVYDCENAAMHGYMLLLEVRKAMLEEGITTGTEDVRAALVLVTPDSAKVNRIYLLAIPPRLANLPSLAAKASQLERREKVVPLGVAVWQRDREPTDEQIVWIQQWLVEGPRAELASREAQKAFKISEGKETETAF
jgi:hypothetical protein